MPIYLGKRVPDTGKRGLDNAQEAIGIATAILQDYVAGKITYRTAMSRLNLLELVVARDGDIPVWDKAHARAYIDQVRAQLMTIRQK